MSKIKGAVVVDTERCKGCNLCVVACPTNTLSLSHGQVNHKGYAYCVDTGDGCRAHGEEYGLGRHRLRLLRPRMPRRMHHRLQGKGRRLT